MRYPLWCLMSAVILLVGLPENALRAQSLKPAEAKVVVPIGVITPLTGFAATFGLQIQHTISELASERSAQSKRYRFVPLVEDGRCGAGQAAVTAVQKLIALNHIQHLITSCSGETLPLESVLQSHKVLTFTVMANHPDISKMGEYVFRTYINVHDGVVTIAKKMVADGHTRIALLTEESAFTAAIAKSFHAELGDRVVFSEDFSPEGGDFRTVLLKARAANPDALYFNCAGPDSCANLTRQAGAQQMRQPIYSYYYFDNPKVRAVAGEAATGAVYLAVPEVKDSSDSFGDFLVRLRAKLGETLTDEFAVRTTYDAFTAIADAVEAVGPDSTKALAFLEGYEKRGALGQVSFDAQGDIKDVHWALKRVVSRERTEYLR